VNNTEQARLEVDRVFSGAGVPSVYGRHQRGYVYWQDFIAGNARDYRVCVVGDFLYGLVRENRPGTPFASGSGQHVPLRIAGDSSGRARAALELAKLVAAELETQWMAFDIVFDAVGRGYVLELSSAWTMDAYADCPCYHRSNLSPASRTGRDSFDIAVEVAELIA
jgi:hypothetical protein